MSADIAITDPCVVFALRRESMHFRRDYPYQQNFPGAPCRAQFRGPSSETVLMLETGLGAVAMETALRWCLNSPRFGDVPYRPRFILSAGFSGALRPEQKVGDLILATEVVDQRGNCWRAITSSTLDCFRGRLLTVSELVSDPRQKQRLGQESGASAVDMESAIVARLCYEHGIPFACLRVISDDLHTPLSHQLLALLRQSRVSLGRLAWQVVLHPALIAELWRLAGHTRMAAKRFAVIPALLAEV
jgi:adenosylhomocysteine nucleosidase